MFFFSNLLPKSAWLTAALDTPNALPTSVKLMYSHFSLVLIFSTIIGILLEAAAF